MRNSTATAVPVVAEALPGFVRETIAEASKLWPHATSITAQSLDSLVDDAYEVKVFAGDRHVDTLWAEVLPPF